MQYFNVFNGLSKNQIDRIQKQRPEIQKKYKEIKAELKRVKDKSIIDCLNQELENLQKQCLHPEAKRTLFSGMVIGICPDCGYLDPASNLYKKLHKKTPE